MSFKVIPTPTFAKSLKALAKRHKSLKEDVKALVAELERDPLQGVELTADIRKISMAIKSKGVGKGKSDYVQCPCYGGRGDGVSLGK